MVDRLPFFGDTLTLLPSITFPTTQISSPFAKVCLMTSCRGVLNKVRSVHLERQKSPSLILTIRTDVDYLCYKSSSKSPPWLATLVSTSDCVTASCSLSPVLLTTSASSQILFLPLFSSVLTFSLPYCSIGVSCSLIIFFHSRSKLVISFHQSFTFSFISFTSSSIL